MDQLHLEGEGGGEGEGKDEAVDDDLECNEDPRERLFTHGAEDFECAIEECQVGRCIEKAGVWIESGEGEERMGRKGKRE